MEQIKQKRHVRLSLVIFTLFFFILAFVIAFVIFNRYIKDEAGSAITSFGEAKDNTYYEQTAVNFGFLDKKPTRIVEDPVLGRQYVYEDGAKLLSINEKNIDYTNSSARVGKDPGSERAVDIATQFLNDAKLFFDGMEGNIGKYYVFSGPDYSETQDALDADAVEVIFSSSGGQTVANMLVTGGGDVSKLVFSTETLESE